MQSYSWLSSEIDAMYQMYYRTEDGDLKEELARRIGRYQRKQAAADLNDTICTGGLIEVCRKARKHGLTRTFGNVHYMLKRYGKFEFGEYHITRRAVRKMPHRTEYLYSLRIGSGMKH